MRGISKRELAEKFKVSPRTVYRTLVACGVSTAKRRYGGDEVYVFSVARNLFRAGFTAQEVREYFSLKSVEDRGDETV